MKKPKLLPRWQEVLDSEFDEEYMVELSRFLKKEYDNGTIYPPRSDIFRALKLVDYDQVKVCILGQDPYHGPDQANGLAFAVKNGMAHPPSLRNIFKEVCDEYGIEYPSSSSLEGWARQGVLLLNTVLTVRHGQAFSHRKKGWEQLTDKIIQKLSERNDPIVFLLWGGAAKAKTKFIEDHHTILTAPHPSPLSAHKGFFGCNHFREANNILKDKIDWSLID